MDVASLRALKRVNLQRVAKEYGIKANLKNDTIIELLFQRFPSKAGSDNVENRADTTVEAEPCTSAHAQPIRTVSNSPPHPPAASSASPSRLPALATGVPSPRVRSDWSADAEPGSSAALSTSPPVREGPAFNGAQSSAAEGSGHLLGGEHAALAQESVLNQVRLADGPAAGPTAYVDPVNMTRRARRRVEREEEARREAARRRLKERRLRRYQDASDDAQPANPTEAECIHTVRAMRRVHNVLRHECDKLEDLEDDAHEVLKMSTGYTKLADANRAMVERMFAWSTYTNPVDPEWRRDEMWGKDPKARVFKTGEDGEVHEEDEETGPLIDYRPSTRALEPTVRATPVTPPQIRKRKRVGNYQPDHRARELFDAIKPQAETAEDGPPRQRRRLASSDPEDA